MQKWILQGKSSKALPTVHIVSDSVGTTALGLVRAAAACFEVFDPAIEILPRVSSQKEMISDIDAHVSFHRRIGEYPFVLFYTLVSPDMRQALQDYIEKNNDIIIAVDAMSPALDALTKASGQ